MNFSTSFFKRHRICLVVLCISTMVVVSPSWSQEQEPPQEQVEPDIEVVVTADRVETETTKIPAHVTVITAEELQAKGKETVVEALEELAGVSFRSYSGISAQAEVSMRGFGGNSHGRVLVLLDGRKLNQPDMATLNWLQVPIENIERIEVVRGGNSVLYGDHAVGGVINIITKKGSQDVKLNAFTSAGSFWGNQERLGVTGMIGPFDLAINAEHTGSQGYREHSMLESIGAGMELGLDITDSLYSSLKLSYEWLYCELPGYLEKDQMKTDPTQSIAANYTGDTENHHINSLLTINALLGEWGRLQADAFYNMKITMFNTSSFTNRYLHSFGVAPRLSADFTLFNRPDKFTVGTDLGWDLLTYDKYNNIDRDTKERSVQVTKGSAGAYISNDFSLLDTLHLSAGLRYELARIAVSALLGTDLDGEKIHQALAWDAGIVWNFIEYCKLYARFESVYRYPFIDEQASYAFGDAFNNDLEAEKGYSIEAGSELVLLERLLTLQLNLFYLEMQDEINWNGVENVNMDSTRRIGGEAGVTINVNDFMVISSNYTYTYPIFTAGSNEGKFIPLVPEHDAFIEVMFNLPFGFSLGSSLNYRGECYQGGDFSNTEEKIADYFLLNGFIKYIPDYIPGKLQIIFKLENILDEVYCTSVYYGGYYPEPGFNWKISVSYSFEL